jgi:triacylglycerol esterase/lipase EstA (alpha/beta hydrolase family)
MAQVNVESPATIFPSQVLAWTMPDDMLDSPVAGTHDMFSAAGPAPATTVPLTNPDGSTVTSLKTFDGSRRYFGSIMANCEAVLMFAIPYLSGTPYPQGVMLPDYNLDSDRGYAWPCWDVDWASPFPWNGCDPYPMDTLGRVFATPQEINWGAKRPNAKQIPPGLRETLTINDPWGNPRSGNAWVNAAALGSPGDCHYGRLAFPSIVVNPNRGGATDQCGVPRPEATDAPGGGLLGPDYLFAPPRFLHSDITDSNADDVVNVYLNLPYSGATMKTKENDGRLTDFLRALTRTADPRLILANAVSLWLGGGSTALPWEGGTITNPPQTPPDRGLATAVAQLAVTGRKAFDAFASWTPHGSPQDADLAAEYASKFPASAFTPAQIQDAATHILDAAYTGLWAIRSNDPGWRAQRLAMPWIAVSGFDDTPHRPVNVPTAPYPQYDLSFTVNGAAGPVNVTTRYMIASAGAWAGRSKPGSTSFTNPNPKVLGDPPGTPPAGSALRTLPQDTPAVPDGDKIIIYIHGGGSKAEEAVDMANWFIIEGKQAGEKYTVISFDLPNSAYGSTCEVTDVTGTPYDYNQTNVLGFILQYIIAFIEQLDAAIGNVKDRIVAVMGGSLGGNTSLLLTGLYDQNHPYLRTIVSWSVTATAPAKYLGFISAAALADFLNSMQAAATQPELPGDHTTQAQYLQDMYTKPLSDNPLLYIPPQPVTWYRGGYRPKGDQDWQPCKDMSIAQSRFDRYEIYSPFVRRWITALDLEQISFSFQDDKPAPQPDARLMLVAGDNDNYFPNAIYNSTIEVTRAIRQSAHGKAEFWLDTGHSIHSERPHLFVKEILYFLAKPDAGDSPNGTVVSTPPKAAYSMDDR